MTNTSLPNPEYSRDTLNQTGIAFNYGEYFERIADALETMAENSTTVATKLTEIAADIDTIKDNTTTLASVVKTINSDNCTDNGPHIRTMAGECPTREGEIDMRRLSRAMMMYNMKASGTLESIKAEMNNPSSF